MTDWKQHDGGPQPVADDVLVTTWSPDEGGWRIPASAVDWSSRGFQWRILNQHLIDAARKEGIRLGLEAAVSAVLINVDAASFPAGEVVDALRALNPDTIAKEAQHD